MVLGPITGKFYQHPKTKKIRLHPSYTINHSIVKGFQNFQVKNLTWYIFLYLLYTTSNYYSIIKGQMGGYSIARCILNICLSKKNPLLIKLK